MRTPASAPIFLAALLSVVLAVGCSPSGEPPEAPLRLRVGTNAIYPPLTFRDGEELA